MATPVHINTLGGLLDFWRLMKVRNGCVGVTNKVEIIDRFNLGPDDISYPLPKSMELYAVVRGHRVTTMIDLRFAARKWGTRPLAIQFFTYRRTDGTVKRVGRVRYKSL